MIYATARGAALHTGRKAMIYEFRTYVFKPGSLPDAIALFAEAYEHRKALSPLAAFWYTEIGPLNQTVQVWPYADLNERARIRAEALQNPHWPPKNHHLLVSQEVEIYIPFPYSPGLEAGTCGPLFEMRRYTLPPGRGVPDTIARWEPHLPRRTALSPLAFVGYTDIGPLNRFVHIWPYPSYAERERVRSQAREQGLWPPPGGAGATLAQESKILLAAPFSPIQ